jgi:hypothetical protein
MASLGFNIGKGLNLAARFTAGAGAFESIGKGNKAAKLVKDTIGLGSNIQEGAGTSLSDRIRGGMSAVSPAFAKGENIRSQIASRTAATKSQGIVDELNENKLEDAREEAILKGTPFEIKTLLPEQFQNNPRILKAIGDMFTQNGSDLDNSGSTSKWEGQQMLAKLQKSGAMQKTMVGIMNDEIKFSDKNIGIVKEQAQTMVDKYNTSADGVAMNPTSDEYTSLTDLREMAKDPEVAGTMDKKLLESIHQIDVIEQNKQLLTKGRDTANASIDSSVRLQEAQIKLTEQKTIKEAQALGVPPAAMNDVWKMKQDFIKQPGIKAYNKVQTQFDMMDSIIDNIDGAFDKGVGDDALIVMFNKLIDPESVVRESEFARTGKHSALAEKWKGKLVAVSEGGAGLTPENRKEILRVSRIMRDSYDKYAMEAAKDSIGFANDFGVKPRHIIGATLMDRVNAQQAPQTQSKDFGDEDEARLTTLMSGGK